GVEISHRSCVNLLRSMARAPGFSASDKLLAVTTLSFDISFPELILPLVTGGQVVLADRASARDGAALRRLLEDSGANVMQATPATWQMLVEAGWRGTPRFKILCGGEALPPSLVRRLLPRCGELWNLY